MKFGRQLEEAIYPEWQQYYISYNSLKADLRIASNNGAFTDKNETDFVEKLRKNDYVIVTGGEGRYMIQRKHGGATEKLVRPEGALPVLRDVLESHRLEMEDGVVADELLGFVREEQPNYRSSDDGSLLLSGRSREPVSKDRDYR